MGNRSVSDIEVHQFSLKLYQLLDAGIPLLQALHVMDPTWKDDRQKERYEALRVHLQAGSTLALAMHAVSFPPFFCSLIAFSEQHGSLVDTLQAVYRFYLKKVQRKQQLIKLLTYPTLVLLTSLVTIILILLFLLPRFRSLYDTLDIPLPWLMRISLEGVSGFFWMFVFLIMGLICLLIFIFSRRSGMLTQVLRLPGIRGLYKLYLNHFITTQLALLLDGGVSILEICRLFREEGPNSLIREAFSKIEQELRRGRSLTLAFSIIPWLLPVFIELLAVAEQSGKVTDILKNLGVQFEQDLDHLLNRTATVLENLLLVGTGLMVFCMLISLFYPMLSVIGQL